MAESGVSVVMPTYNRARYIEEALGSLLRQTLPPLEVVVVDDCSTDDTRVRVERHPLGPRVRYRLQAERGGASVARNAGVEMAQGAVIVFLDSDDVLEPNHHEKVLGILGRSPAVGLVSCDCIMIGPEGERLQADTWTTIQGRIKNRHIHSGLRSLADIFLFSTPFPGMTIRRDVYRVVGGLDQVIFPLDDYDLLLKVAAAGHAVHYEHEALARYRDHGANESGPARAVKVGRKKLECLLRARERYPSLRQLGSGVRRRIGDARRELAVSLLREGSLGPGSVELLRSVFEDPAGLVDFARILRRKVGRAVASDERARVP